nr:hypothetical protein [Tanacetum cinerariifolium]
MFFFSLLKLVTVSRDFLEKLYKVMFLTRTTSLLVWVMCFCTDLILDLGDGGDGRVLRGKCGPLVTESGEGSG